MRALQDRFGRIHDDLRVSVTDRCNLRCSYCMPEEPLWFPRAEILRYEEIREVVRAGVRRGVKKVRITGGEPLVRAELRTLIRMLAAEPGIDDLSLTTNGVLLEAQAAELAEAGLRRLNISLDTLIPERFERLTRRAALERVLRGIDAAVQAGLAPLKVNTVLMRGMNDDEVEPLVERARSVGFELRFIEQMPLGNDHRWDPSSVVSGAEVRTRIGARWPIDPDPARDPHAPATRWLFRDGRGAVGFIDSVSQPFCSTCSRLRLTADGKLRVCLYDDRETDLKSALRSGAGADELDRLLDLALSGKGRGGALDILERRAAPVLTRTMHQIGG
jgi:GTP 3',8-cyclase